MRRLQAHRDSGFVKQLLDVLTLLPNIHVYADGDGLILMNKDAWIKMEEVKGAITMKASPQFLKTNESYRKIEEAQGSQRRAMIDGVHTIKQNHMASLCEKVKEPYPKVGTALRACSKTLVAAKIHAKDSGFLHLCGSEDDADFVRFCTARADSVSDLDNTVSMVQVSGDACQPLLEWDEDVLVHFKNLIPRYKGLESFMVVVRMVGARVWVLVDHPINRFGSGAQFFFQNP